MANLFLLIVDLLALGGLVLLLHYQTPRFGFVPLLLLIGGLIVLTQSQTGIYLEPLEGFVLFLSSNVFIPVILLTVLVLYIANGAVPARMTILSLLALTVLSAVVILVYRLHLNLPTGGTFSGLPIDVLAPPLNLQITFASVVALAADMFGIAVVYQGVKNVAPRLPEWIVVGLALLAALWTDAIVFSILSASSLSDLLIYLPGDVIGKTLSAVVLWPLAAYYLTRVAPRMPDYQGAADRRTFDVLFGSLEGIRLALVRTEKALEKSEAERRQQEAYFKEIADNIQEALWLVAPDTNHPFYVNAAYESIWGRSAASIYADPLSFVNALHPEDRDRVLDGLSAEKFGNYDVEYRVVRPDGSIRWVRDRAFPIRDETGAVYRIVGISEDITERRQVEKDRLELAVEREKVRLLRDFIGEFSHDLKTPLTSINMKMYQLARAEDPDRRQHFLGELMQQTARMSTMIDNLLMLARLENMVAMARTAVDVNQMLREVSDSLRPQLEARSVELALDLNPDIPPLRAVSDDLARAFANLVENAVHYTPAGGLVRVVTAARGDGLLIQFSDTGIGIPKEDQHRIFDRFFRATNARASDSGGTGLGLAIVKKIVEQHGGSIEVSSSVGSGTSFSVTLPLGEA